MKVTDVALTLSLILTGGTAFAEVVTFGKTMRVVDLRSTTTTLLLFPTPPLAVSCQPEGLEFTTLTEESLDFTEREYIRGKSYGKKKDEEEKEGSMLGRFLRVKPTARSGTHTCQFSLNGGEAVGTIFNFREDVVSPLVEFRPMVDDRLTPGDATAADAELTLLRNLYQGKPLTLSETTKDYQKCGREECAPESFATEHAYYRMEYAGAGTGKAAVKLTGRVKRDVSFGALAQFKDESGLVRYSLTLPQKEHYTAGDEITQIVVTREALSTMELRRILP